MRYQADYGMLLWFTDFWCVCVSVEERLTKRTLKRESGIWLIVFIFIFMDC